MQNNLNPIVGNQFDNFLRGTDADDEIRGSGGSDTLIGAQGHDVLDGGEDGQWPDRVAYADDPAGVFVDLVWGYAKDGWGFIDTLINIEGAEGSSFDDILLGNAGDNWLIGSAGADTIDGRDGRDVVFYYPETSHGWFINLQEGTATNGSEIDTLISIEAANGSRFNDTIILRNDSTIWGHAIGDGGDDEITSLAGNDYLEGGSGNDTLTGGDGWDTVSYTDGGYDAAGLSSKGVFVDLVGGKATDNWGFTDSLSGIENVIGSNFGDTLLGSAGDESFDARGGDDSIDGGLGFDTAVLSGRRSDYVVTLLPDGKLQLVDQRFNSPDGIDIATGVEAFRFQDGTFTEQQLMGEVRLVKGTNGNDYLQGTSGDDEIRGYNGSDNLLGRKGNDLLDGGVNGEWQDLALYTDSPEGVVVNLQVGYAEDGWGTIDTLVDIEGVEGSKHDDSLTGDSGDNSFRPWEGSDTIDGGAGNDVVFYENENAVGWEINLAEGYATNGVDTDILLNVEAAHGSNKADTITLLDDSNIWSHVFGRGGNDEIFSLAGNTYISGGSGNDTLYGGDGHDTVTYRDDGYDALGASRKGVTVDLQAGTATDNWGHKDLLTDIEHVEGSAFGDTIRGSDINNRLSGDGGSDTLSGGKGNDTLYGGALGDKLSGDEGDDLINGGSGADTLTGGGGYDELSYSDDPNQPDGLGAPKQGVVVNLATGTATDGWGFKDTISGFYGVTGSSLADIITAADAAPDGDGNPITGGDGADTLTGGTGWDVLRYRPEAGTEGVIVNFAEGRAKDTFGKIDTIAKFEEAIGTDRNDLFIGTDGNQTFRGFAGNDDFDGGAGNNDEISYHSELGEYGVVFDFVKGIATDTYGNVDTFRNIERVRGSRNDDEFTGSNNNEEFRALAGDDIIVGGGGIDTVRYNTDAGRGGFNAVHVDLEAGTATDGFGDKDYLEGIENVIGTGIDDVISGDGANNVLRGLGGNDTLEGRGGNDILEGGDGDDTAIFSGALSDYTVNLLEDGSLELVDIRDGGAGDVDIVKAVEFFQFEDGTYDAEIITPNQRPTAGDDKFTAFVNKPLVLNASRLLANDTDRDGDELSIVEVFTDAQHGTVEFDNTTGTITFTPEADYKGDVVLKYVVSDGEDEAEGTVIVSVKTSEGNKAPAVASGQKFTVGEDVISGGVIKGTDPNLDTLTFSLVKSVAGLNLKEDGTFTLDAKAAGFDSLGAGQKGTVTFQVKASDGLLTSTPALINVTVTGANDAPVGGDDLVGVALSGKPITLTGASLLKNDVDVDKGDKLTINGLVEPDALGDNAGPVPTIVNKLELAYGTVELKSGNLIYTPDQTLIEGLGLAPGARLVEIFEYQVKDKTGAWSTASVELTLAYQNSAPVAVTEVMSGFTADTVIEDSLTGEDRDGDLLTYNLVKPVKGLTLGEDGSYSLDPQVAGLVNLKEGQVGKVTFQFTVSDGVATSKPGTVTLMVTGVNDAPVVSDDLVSYKGKAGSDLVITGSTLLKNDKDPDAGDKLKLVDVDGSAAMGAVTLDVKGNIVYTPAGSVFTIGAGKALTDTFSYMVADTANEVSTGSVTVSLAGVNVKDTGILSLSDSIDEIVSVDLMALKNVTLNANGSAKTFTTVHGLDEADQFILLNAEQMEGKLVLTEEAGDTRLLIDHDNSGTLTKGDGLIKFVGVTGLDLGPDGSLIWAL